MQQPDKTLQSDGSPFDRLTPASVWVLLAGALLLRLLISAISVGSNDALLFKTFAGEIHRYGLVETYRIDGLFNHSPLVGLWALLALRIADVLPHPFGEAAAFCFVFKLPVIAADVFAAVIIWKIWKKKVPAARARAIAAIAAWGVIGILISAYHCNTDPIYAMLCLAAVYFMEERGAFFWGGLLLAAAINVKIVPVLLIPGLLLSCRSLRDARLFIAGLSIGVIPFAAVLCFAAPSFIHNALSYNSNVNRWGINFFLLLASAGREGSAIQVYHDAGRYILFAVIGLWAIGARVLSRRNRYQVAAGTFAIFMVFTPGFGVQYLAIISPLFFAAAPRLASRYALIAGTFALAVYAGSTQHVLPLHSVIGTYGMAESIIGLITWALLVHFLISTIRGRHERDTQPHDLRPDSAGHEAPGSYTSARAA